MQACRALAEYFPAGNIPTDASLHICHHYLQHRSVLVSFPTAHVLMDDDEGGEDDDADEDEEDEDDHDHDHEEDHEGEDNHEGHGRREVDVTVGGSGDG